jgi:nucleotide-binding universal stress UspA family protein
MTMIQIRSILCPVDFSSISNSALKYALALARNHGARLHVIHAVSPVALRSNDFAFNSAEILKQLHKNAEAQMKGLEAEVLRSGVPADFEVRINDPGDEIQRQIRKSKANIVIMGTHGRNTVQRFFLGSVAEHMLRKSPVPIFTVSGMRKSDSRIRSVLIATDFGPGTPEAVEWGIGISRETGAKATLMHVIPHTASANLEETYLTALTRGIEVQLLELAATIEASSLDISVRVETGLPWRVIHNVAQATHPDLIVMNIHGKSRLDRMLLGSTAERIIRSAECPVLSIPPRAGTSGKQKSRR